MRTLMSLSLAFSAAITLADAAEFCDRSDAVATAVSGDLVDLTNQRKLEFFTDGARKNASLRLGYLVPWSDHLTGAFIVKVRHQWTTNGNGGFPAGNWMGLERPSYTSPCTNRDRRAYVGNVKIENYIDFHYYGLPYPTLDEFHADVGIRRRTYDLFLFNVARNICQTTYDQEIRRHFLYSDRIAVASDAEAGARRLAKTQSGGLVGVAFADPPRFYKDKLHTMIIPYRKKEAGAKNCFAFNLAVPSQATSTDVTIVDADQGFFSAFQTTWKLNWKPN